CLEGLRQEAPAHQLHDPPAPRDLGDVDTWIAARRGTALGQVDGSDRAGAIAERPELSAYRYHPLGVARMSERQRLYGTTEVGGLIGPEAHTGPARQRFHPLSLDPQPRQVVREERPSGGHHGGGERALA